MIFNPVYGGESADLGTKTITANGTYQASSDNLDGYSEVTANVPNTYTAADEGKVVQSQVGYIRTNNVALNITLSNWLYRASDKLEFEYKNVGSHGNLWGIFLYTVANTNALQIQYNMYGGRTVMNVRHNGTWSGDGNYSFDGPNNLTKYYKVTLDGSAFSIMSGSVKGTYGTTEVSTTIGTTGDTDTVNPVLFPTSSNNTLNVEFYGLRVYRSGTLIHNYQPTQGGVYDAVDGTTHLATASGGTYGGSTYALEAQTSRNISANDTYDTTLNNEVVVDVQPNLGTKNITANGTYNASSDSLDGYSSVSVSVSGGGGATILSGTTDPASGTGSNGDLYLKYITASVPTGYTQVDYLQSSGTQYINTGVVPTDVTRIDIDFALTATPGNWYCLLGSQGNYNTGANSLLWTWTNSRLNFRWGSGSNQIGMSSALSLNTRYKFKGTDEVKFYVDDTLQGSTSKGTTNSDLSIHLFGNNIRGQGSGQRVSAKIYECIIYDTNADELRHFIPAIRDADSVAGMYETVTDTFYTNSGSGTFSTGSAFEGGDITAAFAKVNGAWQALIGTNIDDINL